MAADVPTLLAKARDTALSCIDAGNWAGVITQCQKALLILSTIPDSRIGNKSDLEWDRRAILKMMVEAKEALAAANLGDCGFDVCQVEYTGSGTGTDSCSGGCSC